jgi:hypothetical protein
MTGRGKLSTMQLSEGVTTGLKVLGLKMLLILGRVPLESLLEERLGIIEKRVSLIKG